MGLEWDSKPDIRSNEYRANEYRVQCSLDNMEAVFARLLTGNLSVYVIDNEGNETASVVMEPPDIAAFKEWLNGT